MIPPDLLGDSLFLSLLSFFPIDIMSQSLLYCYLSWKCSKELDSLVRHISLVCKFASLKKGDINNKLKSSEEPPHSWAGLASLRRATKMEMPKGLEQFFSRVIASKIILNWSCVTSDFFEISWLQARGHHLGSRSPSGGSWSYYSAPEASPKVGVLRRLKQFIHGITGKPIIKPRPRLRCRRAEKSTFPEVPPLKIYFILA